MSTRLRMISKGKSSLEFIQKDGSLGFRVSDYRKEGLRQATLMDLTKEDLISASELLQEIIKENYG